MIVSHIVPLLKIEKQFSSDFIIHMKHFQKNRYVIDHIDLLWYDL